MIVKLCEVTGVDMWLSESVIVKPWSDSHRHAVTRKCHCWWRLPIQPIVMVTPLAAIYVVDSLMLMLCKDKQRPSPSVCWTHVRGNKLMATQLCRSVDVIMPELTWLAEAMGTEKLSVNHTVWQGKSEHVDIFKTGYRDWGRFWQGKWPSCQNSPWLLLPGASHRKVPKMPYSFSLMLLSNNLFSFFLKNK